MTRLPLLLVLAVLGAGCVSEPTLQAAAGLPTAREVAIHVTDEPDGPAVAGASIFVPDANATYVADANGDATVSLPRGDRAIFVTAPERTREPILIRASQRDATVPLYRSHLHLVIDGALGPAAAGTYPVNGRLDWHALDVAWGGSSEAARGYADRVVRLNATLRWNNTPLSTGDLALGLSARQERADVVADDGRQTGLGPQQEEIRMELRDLARWRGAEKLYSGAGVSTEQVAPSGSLPYTITLDADFDPSVPRPSPAHGAVAAIGALAVAALLAAGRRAG